MMEDFFKYKSPNFEKLRVFGFQEQNAEYVYATEIFDGQFTLTVRISKKGGVVTELLDNLTEEPYTLHLVEDAAGEFVGRVREEYAHVLREIADLCYEKDVFQGEEAHALIAHVREKYGDELEFLWARLPDAAIWRRKDNDKWYAVIMIIERKKLGLQGEGKVEVLDVRADPQEAELLVDNVRIFKGYHMNKKHWISLPMDGSVSVQELIERLEESWFIAGRK